MISTIIQLDLPAVLLLLLAVAGGLWLRSWWRERAGQTAREPLAASLEVAQRKIREFATSQGLFVSALAEEIRAPLGTALIHAELLLASSREPATVERYANGLVEDVRHLTGLVDSFLRLVHPMTQEDTSSHVPVHVHDVVMAAATRCKYLASTRDVTIVPTLAEPRDGATLEVLGNTVLLEAMLENLLRNAVVSSPRGSRVALHVRQLGDEVRVAVHDRGPPIPDESLDEVFSGFFQGPEPLRPPLASGLSLAIAMRVAEHHRGTISLVNVPEGGCQFEVQLPRWRGDLAVASRPASTRT